MVYGLDKASAVAFDCNPDNSVTVINSPALKSAVGLMVTCVVPPPLKLAAMIPVWLPETLMFVLFTVPLATASLKVSTISALLET